MEPLSKQLEEIVKETNENQENMDQLSKLDELLEKFDGLQEDDKPLFNLPPRDTIGKEVLTNLNKR